MNITLKEASGSKFWLMLLYDTDYLEGKAFEALLADIHEIISKYR